LPFCFQFDILRKQKKNFKISTLMKIVVKIGSSVLTGSNSSSPISKEVLFGIASQAARLLKMGHEIVIVTSGAVASCRKNFSKSLRAAMGQPRLMKLYCDAFEAHGLETCQFLFTHADLKGEKSKYTKRLVLEALKGKIIPVINANDSVTSEELDALREYADNDVLASRMATMIGADFLFILIKEPGLMDFKRKKVILEISDFKEALKLARGKSRIGTGGMESKIRVAKFLKSKNIETRLLPGRVKNSLIRSAEGEDIGTRFI
jgi:glutamate 5-kinase